MPQFLPGESKIAIAPITARPAGMSCEAELFLGPDEATKVATSGKIPFVSTGAAKNVSLPITMPSQEGSFHGYIDVFTEGLRFLAYKTTEDVVIAAPVPPILRTGGVEILNVNGVPFSEVGPGYAVLSHPISIGPDFAFTLSVGNLPRGRPGDGIVEWMCRAQGIATDPQQYLARLGLPTIAGGVRTARFYRWYTGRGGGRDFEFSWGYRQWDLVMASMGNDFTIRNMVR